MRLLVPRQLNKVEVPFSIVLWTFSQLMIERPVNIRFFIWEEKVIILGFHNIVGLEKTNKAQSNQKVQQKLVGEGLVDLFYEGLDQDQY